jgi:hypothetical protein
MDDVTAGSSSPGPQQGGSTGPWGGGSPPPVLLAAMGAALLIAVTLTAFLIGSGSGNDDLTPAASSSGSGGANGGSSATGDTDGRVRLRVTFDGDGGGEIKISPAGIACSETCSNDIVTDTRVRVTADADIGSKFSGWGDACDGREGCVFYMDRSRELGVTFDKTEAAKKPIADCDNDDIPDSQDSGCDDPPPAPDDATSAAPASDCHDGKDNDGDGLIDNAQDPGCDFGSEGATSKDDAVIDPLDDTTASPPPSPPAAPNDCSDGKDNDGDGLTDTAQDPGCDKGGTEAD